MESTDVVYLEFLLPYSKIFLYIWLCIDLFLYAQFISYAQLQLFVHVCQPYSREKLIIKIVFKTICQIPREIWEKDEKNKTAEHHE